MMKIWHRFLPHQRNAALFHIVAQSMSGTHVRNQQCAMIMCQIVAVDISPMVQVCFMPTLSILSFNNYAALHIGLVKLQLGYLCMPTAAATEHCRVWRA